VLVYEEASDTSEDKDGEFEKNEKWREQFMANLHKAGLQHEEVSFTGIHLLGRKRIAVCATSAAPLREITCHMGSHSVTCHPAEVRFPPLPQPIKAGTRFSDPRGMQG